MSRDNHHGTGITVRNLHLGHEAMGAERWYVDGDPFATAFYNALTIVFPPGERFFIESVRPFWKGAPEPLSSEIADFIRQEALHTREHEAFNEQVRTSGYSIDDCDARTENVLAKQRERSPVRQLAFTICIEHFTALLADEVLSEDRHLAAMPDNVRRLWEWHALEEIEHKAVAFDTYLWATRKWSKPRRWAFRSWALLATTWVFAVTTAANMHDLLKQDGMTGTRARLRSALFVFGKGGIGRAIAAGWFGWFKPGFHPWDHDNTALIKNVSLGLEGSAGVPA